MGGKEDPKAHIMESRMYTRGQSITHNTDKLKGHNISFRPEFSTFLFIWILLEGVKVPIRHIPGAMHSDNTPTLAQPKKWRGNDQSQRNDS